jgi:hypothetical protein
MQASNALTYKRKSRSPNCQHAAMIKPLIHTHIHTGIKRIDIQEEVQEPKPLARSNYLMSKQLEGFPGMVKGEGEHVALQQEDVGAGDSEVLHDAIKKMNVQIERRLAAAAEEIEKEDVRQQEGKG